MGPFLTTEWGPWLIVAAVALLALLLWRFAPRGRAPRVILRGVSAILACAAVALGVGRIALMLDAAAIQRARPPEGRFVDVGGYRLFVLCEGPRTADTVVWLSGGYSSGFFMLPLHRLARAERRSCLIDRPGVGFADAGPVPRTVDLILRELHDGLNGAGETGPLILAGHSMGGLYAANFAQAYPARVKAVVMLDPTPPMWFVEMGETMGCGRSDRATPQLWMSVFGVGLIRAINPLFGPALNEQRAAIGAFWPTLAAMQSRPSSLQGDWSAGSWACAHPTALVRAPGALGDLPLFKIVQAPKANRTAEAPPGLSSRRLTNWLAMREAWDGEYVTATRRGVLEYAPTGYTHSFPITEAVWTYGRVRLFLAGLDRTEIAP